MLRIIYCILCILLIQLIVVSAIAQPQGRVMLSSYRAWPDTKIPCGDLIIADTLGYLTFFSGCEGRGVIGINRYILKRDTIVVMPYDYLQEDVFLEIKKIPANGTKQRIAFFGADGEKVTGSIDSSFLVRLIDRKNDKIIDHTGNNIVEVPRRKYQGVEILKLEMIFGVPIVFWLREEFDYEIKINAPAQVLNYGIIGRTQIQDKNLMIINGELQFPRQKMKKKF